MRFLFSAPAVVALSTSLASVAAAQTHTTTHAAHSTAAAKTFEGPITYEVTPEHGPVQDFTYLVKGTKIRFDIPQNTNGDEEATFAWLPPKPMRRYWQWTTLTQINDEATGEAVDIITGWNRYYRDVPDTVALKKAPPVRLAVTKVGTSETIAGMSCDDYTVSDSSKADTTAQICVVSGMGVVTAMDGPVSNATPIIVPYAFAKAHFKAGFLPIKYVNMVGGQPHGQIVVTAIAKQTLAPTMFAPSPGMEQMTPDQNNMF